MELNKKSNTFKVETMVMAALMTALVVVFQCLATYTTFFGPFSTAIGLIPIVIGAVLCGPIIGGWLGLVFGVVVLVTGGRAGGSRRADSGCECRSAGHRRGGMDGKGRPRGAAGIAAACTD